MGFPTCGDWWPDMEADTATSEAPVNEITEDDIMKSNVIDAERGTITQIPDDSLVNYVTLTNESDPQLSDRPDVRSGSIRLHLSVLSVVVSLNSVLYIMH